MESYGAVSVRKEFHALSREYVRVKVSAKEDGSVVDPTSDTVTMAVVSGSVVAGDFKAASWETDATTTPDTYYARVEIGPGSTVGALTAGTYNVYVKVVDNPEQPVLAAGSIRVV